MEDKEFGWAPAVGAGLLVLIFLSLAITIGGKWHWFNDSAAASWVQAIVAMIAVIAGAVGLVWQAGENRRLEVVRVRVEESRRLGIVFGAVFDLRARLEASTWHELGPYQANWRRVDEAVELLRTIPLLDLPDWKVAFAIRQAVDSYAYLRRWVPHDGSSLPPPEWHTVAYQRVDDARAHASKALEHIRESLNTRRALVPTINMEFEGGTISSGKAD